MCFQLEIISQSDGLMVHFTVCSRAIFANAKRQIGISTGKVENPGEIQPIGILFKLVKHAQ